MTWGSHIIEDPRWNERVGTDPVKLAAARERLFDVYVSENPERARWFAQQPEEEQARLRQGFAERISKAHENVFRVETGRESQRWTEKQISGGGGIMMRTGPDIEREKEVVHTRPLYDLETEIALQEGRPPVMKPEEVSTLPPGTSAMILTGDQDENGNDLVQTVVATKAGKGFVPFVDPEQNPRLQFIQSLKETQGLSDEQVQTLKEAYQSGFDEGLHQDEKARDSAQWKRGFQHNFLGSFLTLKSVGAGPAGLAAHRDRRAQSLAAAIQVLQGTEMSDLPDHVDRSDVQTYLDMAQGQPEGTLQTLLDRRLKWNEENAGDITARREKFVSGLTDEMKTLGRFDGTAGERGWLGVPKDVLRQLGGSAASPENLIGLGHTGTARTIGGKILMSATSAAVENMMVEASIQPLIQSARAIRGEETGMKEAATDLAFAAGAGFGLGGLAGAARVGVDRFSRSAGQADALSSILESSSDDVWPAALQELRQKVSRRETESGDWVDYSVVDARTAKRIRAALEDHGGWDLDLAGRVHRLDSASIRHSEKGPGKGELPLTKEDWLRLPEVVRDFDSVEPSRTRRKEPALVFTKRFNGELVAVEVVNKPGAAGDFLSLKTYSKRKAPGPRVAENQLLGHTSETGGNLQGNVGDVGRRVKTDGGSVTEFATSPLRETVPPPRASLPDWVKSGAETPKGRQLIGGIERPGRRPEFGPRSIVDFVNKAVDVEMRKSRSQTTRRNPAHYRPIGHVVFTRDGNRGDYGFHEAGHGLKELIEAREPGFFDQEPQMSALLAITERPGSMASARNVHEGVAEWTRLRIKDPGGVEGLPITAAIERAIRQYLPGVDASIRDAARAWERFQRQPAEMRWQMLNRDLKEVGTFRLANILSTMGGAIDRIMPTWMASGSSFSAIDRRIFRSIVRNRKEMDKTWQAAVRVAREQRRQTKPLLYAHNNILQISSEVQNAFSGKGKFKGLRIIGRDGNFQLISGQTWQEVMGMVPGSKWNQFQHAGWARESLNRWEKARMEYPGMREGMPPKDLQTIVDQARREIPRFDEAFAAVQRYFDTLLDIKDYGGLKKLGEVERMRQRGEYWPLPRVMWGGGQGGGMRTRSGPHIHAGDRRAHGSGEAIRDLTEVAEQRTREALQGYYWNQLGLRMVENLGKIARNKELPMSARAIAGRVMQPLKLQRKVAATMGKEEGQRIIADFLNSNLQPGQPEIKPEMINLAWDFKEIWRATAPSDYNVVSLLQNGERRFFQVEDPVLFQYFANTGDASPLSRAAEWTLLPEVENWKRNITQSFPFAILRNLPGDLFNQMALGQGLVSWIPGGATTLGMWNRAFKKYPQVFDKGLLLSRSEPSSVELVNRTRRSAVWHFLSEGLYVSRHPNRLVRVVSTVLQPGNLLWPVHKVVDLGNLLTLGRHLAPFLEGASREGSGVYQLMRGRSDEAAKDAYWSALGRFNEHPGQADVRTLARLPGFFNPMI